MYLTSSCQKIKEIGRIEILDFKYLTSQIGQNSRNLLLLLIGPLYFVEHR